MPVDLIHADCLEAMRDMPDASIDAVVTDPPYGLGFMGKDWDHGVPGAAFWTEALRVTKPGGYLLAFGGTRTFHRLAVAIEDAGWEIRDCLSWLYGSGFPKSLNVGGGRGTALKPAWEPVILARKPLDGTVAANVLAHGTGAINVDACRIGTETVGWSGSRGGSDDATQSMGRNYRLGAGDPRPVTGRWPANVALDEEAAAMLDAQTGVLHGHGSTHKVGSQGWFSGAGPTRSVNGGDSGGASRFFYCAKASRSERDAGCENVESQQRDETRKEGDPGGDNPRNRGVHQRKNFHPTVKPLALMRWLVRLVCPPGGTVLDPFAGSGTTGLAAHLEGFNAVLVEMEADYIAIIEGRFSTLTTNPDPDEDK